MIKEMETENIRNYRIDNAKRASNCQLNCFVCRVVFKSAAPRRDCRDGKREKEMRVVYKTTDDRARIENRKRTLSRDRMDRIDFFERAISGFAPEQVK